MAFEHWYCEGCKRDGTVRYRKRAGVQEVRDLIAIHHRWKSKECADVEGLSHVRIGPAATVTKGSQQRGVSGNG